MRSSLLRLLLLILVPATLHAQATVYTAAKGVVLLSDKPGCYYTLDIHGRSVLPAGMESSPNPLFNADGKFLQVITVSAEEFRGTAKMSDEEFLRKQLAYEADFHKLKVAEIKVEVTALPGGKKALFWTFRPPMPNAREQAFLTIRSTDHAIVFGSALEPPQTLKEIRSFLLETAATFHRSETPMTLKFASDGTYERKPK